MKTTSASPDSPVNPVNPATPAAPAPLAQPVLVWDAPVRVFHWLMVLCFAGTRHARFTAFVRGPKAVMAYLQALLRRQPAHHIGHNPAGAVAIVLLLGLAAGIGATGWATYNDVAGEWVAELHELLANGMLLVVGIHVAGVVVASVLHQENLVGAMLTGRKRADPSQGIRSAWRTVALVMLVAVLGFWVLQWHSAPNASSSGGSITLQSPGGDHDHDGD